MCFISRRRPIDMQFVTLYAVSVYQISSRSKEAYTYIPSIGVPLIEAATRSQTSIDSLYTPTPLYHLRVNTHLCAVFAHASSAALSMLTCDLATLLSIAQSCFRRTVEMYFGNPLASTLHRINYAIEQGVASGDVSSR